ncbi:uncharacterized protein LOC126570193 [Anopheles aquasalis]|uniref:uncharacterized protein LOC126570193 n=1 Tax=Anopheles aquasalis TaxID=42839 RepID=UPI00215B0C89|nr:uncharacterized protein LOC126570193 [Anopheles aquasalis]
MASSRMASRCVSITVITVVILSMVSLGLCKPFLGDILARAITSSSTPDDPQSHISDFRMTSKMDTLAAKLKLEDSNAVVSKNQSKPSLNETLNEESEEPSSGESPEEFLTPPIPTSSYWSAPWNRTEVLARFIDNFVRPVQQSISLAFERLVSRNPFNTAPKSQEDTIVAPRKAATSDVEHVLKSLSVNDTDELGLELVALDEGIVAALIDPSVNGSTLVSQLQARRHMIRRRVAKALSSITGLLILAANTRRESKSRNRRSMEITGSEELEGSGTIPDIYNEISTGDNDDSQSFEDPLQDEPFQGSNRTDAGVPRRNVEAFGIFILEVFGSIAGFSWGIFKQVQSLFW